MKSAFSIFAYAAIVVAAFAFYCFTAPTSFAAFGISPPFVVANHLVPGITYTQTVYLLRDDASEDLPIKTTFSIPQDIASWITVDEGSTFTIPSGTRQFPVQISIHVPEGATLGKYNGTITFTSAPAQSGKISIALGAAVALNITVGSDIFESFSVPLITFPDIEEGWNPEVYVKFENDGNIPEAFDGATFTLFDQYDSVQLAYMQKSDGFPQTKPFSTNSYTLEFPTSLHLGVGEYWGNVVFYQNQKVIASQKTIFHVLPAGSISGPWGRIAHYLSENPWVIYAGTVVLVVLILLGVFIYRLQRKKKKAALA